MGASTFTKILSALALVTLAAGLVAFSLVRTAVSSNPEKITRLGAEIADFSLPAGYRLQYGVKAFGYTLVAAAPEQGSGHIFLAQAADGSKLERLLGGGTVSIVPGRRDERRPRDITVIGTQEVVLRGQSVTLALGEGVNSQGETYRELSGLFEGRGGGAMVNISAPLTQWDETDIEAFLASIR